MLDRVLEPEVMDNADEAAAYDAMDHAEPNAAFVERLLSLGVGRCDKALDLGTGPGDIPILLCKEAAPLPGVFAVDLAQTMLVLARAKVAEVGLAERIMLAQMDVKALDLPDASFDAVFSNTILHHIPEPLAMLQEAARVLYDLPERPKEKAFRTMAEAWAPWRSVAARLLWAYYRVEKNREGII